MHPHVEGAYDAALTGDLDAGRRALALLATETSPAARAWSAALSGLLALSSPSSGRSEDPQALLSMASDDPLTLTALARAGAHFARSAALAFDAGGLAQADEVMSRLVVPGISPEADGWQAITRAWRSIAMGRNPGALLEPTIKAASKIGRADLVLEATALSALGLENAGDVPGALAIARRVSRMGRTEALPHCEFLANLILARMRRLDGKPHLAARILHALHPLVSAPWQPWLCLELRLALSTGPVPIGQRGGAPVLALDRALASARSGDRPGFDAAIGEALTAVAGFFPIHVDLFGAKMMIDPEIPLSEISTPWRAWAEGSITEPPRGLIGLTGDPGSSSQAAGWVWAPGPLPPRRVLTVGKALAKIGPGLRGQEEDAPQLRTDSAIAVLTLAGPAGLVEEVLFQRLYGFAYEPGRHQSVRDVLYQRVKKRASPARLERREGRVTLLADGPLLVPDPRSSAPPELRILRILGQRKVAAPKEVASELGISLRTAQDALSRLAEDGAVKRERARAGLHYILEDTTFSEPTRRFRSS